MYWVYIIATGLEVQHFYWMLPEDLMLLFPENCSSQTSTLANIFKT
uniref:Uncharacterized protein n=1 Tax=Setaria italica TaxID=4555 RepID=K3ZPS1_SETIT